MKKYINLHLLFIIGVFIVFAVFSVIYFTRASYSSWNFSSTGQIGDTIGGLTAPVIGILNAVLLYITIKRQDDQINRQEAQRQEDRVYHEFDRRLDFINALINSLTFTTIKIKDVPIKTAGQRNVYNGSRCLLVLLIYINKDKPILQKYKPIASDWLAFSEKVRQILEEASKAVFLNMRSSLSFGRKLDNYEYVFAKVYYIIECCKQINAYQKKFPESLEVKAFMMKAFENFEPYINTIEESRPKKLANQ